MNESDKRKALDTEIDFVENRLHGHAVAIGSSLGKSAIDVYRLFLLATNVIRIGNGLIAAAAKYVVDDGSERMPTDHIPDAPKVSLSNWTAPKLGLPAAEEQIERMTNAVKEFLGKRGHDLCHENRRKLAAAFGLPDPGGPDKAGVSFNEFCEGCADYQQQLYGRSWREVVIRAIASEIHAGINVSGPITPLFRVCNALGIRKEVDVLLAQPKVEDAVNLSDAIPFLLPLSITTAQRLNVCRLCGKRTGPDGKDNPLVLGYGREYAHGYCLEQRSKSEIQHDQERGNK